MKKFITATVIAACIALCAAVWLQSKVVKENTRPGPQLPAVCATEAAGCRTQNGSPNHANVREKKNEAVPTTKAPLEILR